MIGRRLLLMDDDPAVRALTARMASKIGWALEAVADADQAVAAFSEARTAGEPFEVVILDLTIPGGRGGAEVLAELRLLEPGVVALVTSGWSEGAVVTECEAHGFDAALPKPYTASELEGAIGRALGNAYDR
jgi:CheY-like chemotaxis protein